MYKQCEDCNKESTVSRQGALITHWFCDFCALSWDEVQRNFQGKNYKLSLKEQQLLRRVTNLYI